MPLQDTGISLSFPIGNGCKTTRYAKNGPPMQRLPSLHQATCHQHSTPNVSTRLIGIHNEWINPTSDGLQPHFSQYASVTDGTGASIASAVTMRTCGAAGRSQPHNAAAHKPKPYRIPIIRSASPKSARSTRISNIIPIISIAKNEFACPNIAAMLYTGAGNRSPTTRLQLAPEMYRTEPNAASA